MWKWEKLIINNLICQNWIIRPSSQKREGEILKKSLDLNWTIMLIWHVNIAQIYIFTYHIPDISSWRYSYYHLFIFYICSTQSYPFLHRNNYRYFQPNTRWELNLKIISRIIETKQISMVKSAHKTFPL